MAVVDGFIAIPFQINESHEVFCFMTKLIGHNRYSPAFTVCTKIELSKKKVQLEIELSELVKQQKELERKIDFVRNNLQNIESGYFFEGMIIRKVNED